MCGRFVQNFAKSDIDPLFEGLIVDAHWINDSFKASFNVAPGQEIWSIWPKRSESQPILRRSTWGYKIQRSNLPSQYDNGSKPIINMRSDRLVDSYNWSGAIRENRRLLIPASGWYEWKRVGVTAKQTKIPYYFSPVESQSILFFAALADQQGNIGLITEGATDSLAKIHHRMPLMLNERKQQELWLYDTKMHVNDIVQYLNDNRRKRPSIKQRIVSERVNKIKNNDANLIKETLPPPIQGSLF